MTDRDIMKQALDALTGVLDDDPKVLMASISGGLYEVVQCRDVITALRERLSHCDRCGKKLGGEGDIHTCSPPQRTWVGLTDEEVKQRATMMDDRLHLAFYAGMYQAQQILKEKNNGN